MENIISNNRAIVSDDYCHEPCRDLFVGAVGVPEWLTPPKRRWSFHNLDQVVRYGMTVRSSNILNVHTNIDPQIGNIPVVDELITRSDFSGFVVMKGNIVVYEKYGSDFPDNQRHSLQSIGKLIMGLIIGKLVDEQSLNLAEPVQTYVPEIGTGYQDVSVQQVLDMDVINNFTEDYADSYQKDVSANVSLGNNRHEIAMGWRLPPKDEVEFSCRSFVQSITSGNTHNWTGEMSYRSPNTDLLGWIAERASNKSIQKHLVDIVEAIGMEHSLFITTDCEGVPAIATGACMSARDLARLGLLLANSGRGVGGRKVGSPSFVQETIGGRGTIATEQLRYRNHSYTNGRWLGHPGLGGQFLLADPKTETSLAYLSVSESDDPLDYDHLFLIMLMQEKVLSYLDNAR